MLGLLLFYQNTGVIDMQSAFENFAEWQNEPESTWVSVDQNEAVEGITRIPPYSRIEGIMK